MPNKCDNTLSVHGNRSTMNLNHMILTNIQSSYYFKVELYELKTYHEVIDEIYNKVSHLEPWEKGSRHTRGLKGMCGGVRGVGGGGIVSTAFCLLYKLYTLKLTRKQVIGLTTNKDSPYIRALGFIYLRYTQPPEDLWDWFQEFFADKEELDVKAGGGEVVTIGKMLQRWLVRIDWFDTLFPRIPISVQKLINAGIVERFGQNWLETLSEKDDPESTRPKRHHQQSDNLRRRRRNFDDDYDYDDDRIRSNNRGSNNERYANGHWRDRGYASDDSRIYERKRRSRSRN